MRIDIRDLKDRDCFQFIGEQTIYQIEARATRFFSKEVNATFSVPTRNRLEVISEDWMRNTPIPR